MPDEQQNNQNDQTPDTEVLEQENADLKAQVDNLTERAKAAEATAEEAVKAAGKLGAKAIAAAAKPEKKLLLKFQPPKGSPIFSYHDKPSDWTPGDVRETSETKARRLMAEMPELFKIMPPNAKATPIKSQSEVAKVQREYARAQAAEARQSEVV